VKLREMNFKVPKMEELNLSHTRVDDETLHVISKSCCRLLKLSVESCCYVTEKGVNHVVMNCTQLKEINLGYCRNVNANIVGKMILSRPSLRKIKPPPGYRFIDKNFEL
jgi:F-box and leucine-rich repeat protein 2/20